MWRLEAGAYQMAAEGKHGRSPGLQRIRADNGNILFSEAAVQDEIFSFFSAIFQGRHVATTDPASNPVDSGVPFAPDCLAFPQFLDGLPLLSSEECDGLEVPFSLAELEAAVTNAAPNTAPGLDVLSCEFYCTTLPIIGPHLLAACPPCCPPGSFWYPLGMLLCISFPAVPTVVQLCPVTLLSVEYKI
jgi:hypothetical protein